jgi:hypothetical protein
MMDGDDLVRRLRSPEVFIDTGGMFSPVAHEAADEIERVCAELVVAKRDVTFYYYKWKDETEKNAKLSNVLHHLSKLKDVQKYKNVSFEELTNYVQKITRAALGEKKDV